MRRKLLVPIVLALTIALGAASPATAREPLGGPMDLQFNLLWSEPSEVIPTWVEAANDPYAHWLGRKVHMNGNIEFSPLGAPIYAPGTFRLN